MNKMKNAIEHFNSTPDQMEEIINEPEDRLFENTQIIKKKRMT